MGSRPIGMNKMTATKIQHIVPLLLLVVVGCLEPFDPEIADNYKNFLVVDGIITDQPGPYTIKINRAVALDQPGYENSAVSGVEVVIEEENGVVEILSETSAGIYQTDVIQGKVGRQYRLKLSYKGQQYKSSWEKISASASIDKVYFSVEAKETTDPGIDIRGVQFYVDSKGGQEVVKHYRYEWEETWEIGVTHRAFYDYFGNDVYGFTSNPLHRCWKYGSSREIILASAEDLSDVVITQQKVAFITGEDERFARKHSLLVKQFALNEDEYFFWKLLHESSKELGTLYDKQPATITGNIANSAHPDDVVLGYFSASGLQEERIFVLESYGLSQITPCNPDVEILLKSLMGDTYEKNLLRAIANGAIYYRAVEISGVGVVGAVLADPDCTDCRTKGGDLNKPKYWGY